MGDFMDNYNKKTCLGIDLSVSFYDGEEAYISVGKYESINKAIETLKFVRDKIMEEKE